MPPGGGRGGRSFLTAEEQANKPKVTPALLKRIFSYLLPYWPQFLLSLLLLAAASILGLFPSLLTGRIIDEGLIGRDLGLLVRYLILSFVVMLSSSLIGILQGYLNSWIAQHITYDMRSSLFRHLLKMSQRFFTTESQGDLITRMTSDVEGVQSTITFTFANILSNVITLVTAVVMMMSRNWILALAAMVIVPLMAIPTRAAGRTRWELARESQSVNDEVNGILGETLSVSGQLLVKLFGRENYEAERYESLSKKLIKLNLKESMAGRGFMAVISTVAGIGPMLLYLMGGILMMRYDADLSVGDITVLVTLVGRMYGPVNALLSVHVDWVRSMALFDRLFAYFDMEPEVKEPQHPIIPETARGEVRFENVRFSYVPEREILQDISFSLNAGHSVAIVGPSGSGKSTLVNLIPRLYDATGGRVFFDGRNVKYLDLAWLRSQIGVVTQDTYLFNGTIRENLLYAKPDATDEELLEACRKANIYDFIMDRPEGLEAMVGNRGLKLSGGEKQRLSIARALLKDPVLLIFDEATSSLDSISEARIQEAIEPLIKSRSSILIAHRLSTILAADEILVISGGKIAERGTHRELVQAGGVYTELYNTQFRRPEEAADGAEETPDMV